MPNIIINIDTDRLIYLLSGSLFLVTMVTRDKSSSKWLTVSSISKIGLVTLYFSMHGFPSSMNN